MCDYCSNLRIVKKNRALEVRYKCCPKSRCSNSITESVEIYGMSTHGLETSEAKTANSIPHADSGLINEGSLVELDI